MTYRRAIGCYQSVTGKILTIPNRPPDEFIAAEFCLKPAILFFSRFYTASVGCCHLHFPIAVVDLDAVMTGNSRPSGDSRQFPINVWLILKSGHSKTANNRELRT